MHHALVLVQKLQEKRRLCVELAGKDLDGFRKASRMVKLCEKEIRKIQAAMVSVSPVEFHKREAMLQEVCT